MVNVEHDKTRCETGGTEKNDRAPYYKVTRHHGYQLSRLRPGGHGATRGVVPTTATFILGFRSD
jgi:hypothetical protein